VLWEPFSGAFSLAMTIVLSRSAGRPLASCFPWLARRHVSRMVIILWYPMGMPGVVTFDTAAPIMANLRSWKRE
jgi:hypothetical protein